MLVVVLLVLAFLCEAIAALVGFDVLTGAHLIGWVAAGLAFGYAASIVGAAPWGKP